jgi:hypothetical protein
MKFLKKETAQNLTIMLVFFLLTLFCVEVGFRVIAYKKDLKIAYALGEGDIKPEKGKSACLN